MLLDQPQNKKRPYCRYGWYDGDERWVYKDLPRAGLHNQRGIDFYYVVTRVEFRPEKHQPVYHLVTGAMTGNKGYAGGYSTQESHIPMTLVKRPPAFIVRDSERFLGIEMSCLL